MKALLQIIVLVLLTLASAAIVFVVNAPKLLDGTPVATTRRA